MQLDRRYHELRRDFLPQSTNFLIGNRFVLRQGAAGRMKNEIALAVVFQSLDVVEREPKFWGLAPEPTTKSFRVGDRWRNNSLFAFIP